MVALHNPGHGGTSPIIPGRCRTSADPANSRWSSEWCSVRVRTTATIRKSEDPRGRSGQTTGIYFKTSIYDVLRMRKTAQNHTVAAIQRLEKVYRLLQPRPAGTATAHEQSSDHPYPPPKLG